MSFHFMGVVMGRAMKLSRLTVGDKWPYMSYKVMVSEFPVSSPELEYLGSESVRVESFGLECELICKRY